MLPFGTKETFFIPEIAELRRRGHVVILVPMRPSSIRVHRKDLEMDVLRQPLLSFEVLAGAFDMAVRSPARTMRALLGLLRSRSLAILIKNLAAAPKGLWLAHHAVRSGADHIHAQWAGTTATIGMIASIVSGVPWTFTAHRWDIRENNLIAVKMRSARAVRAISNKGLAALAKICPDRAAQLHLGRMGVEVSNKVAPMREVRDSLSFVVIANLVEVKGHRYLIQAMSRALKAAKKLRLDVVGGGPLHDDISRQIQEEGLEDAVTMRGVVPHEKLLASLTDGNWDGVVLPSITTASGEEEGVPVSLMEAMAAGVPVVSTRTGAIEELVGVDAGLLVAERDPDALQEAMVSLFDHRAAARLAAAGRARILAEYEVTSTVDRFLLIVGKDRPLHESSAA